MIIHLDTSFLIRSTNASTPDARRLGKWLGEGQIVNINTITLGEFRCGPLKPADRTAVLELFLQPEPFTVEDAVIASELFNSMGRSRRHMADCMIAASAIRCDAAVATQIPGTTGDSKLTDCGWQILTDNLWRSPTKLIGLKRRPGG